MPLFWFVNFTNRIKRIRDKTFCFNVQLGPNPHTQHTSRIHGEGCNSEELRGICMFEPTFVAWETRNNRFTISKPILPIASKRRVTPKVTKKEKQTRPTDATINQTNKGVLTSLKGCIFVVSIWGSRLKLLRVACTFGQYLSSPSLSLPIPMRLLPRGDLGLYLYLYLFYCAYIFNSLGICA